MAPSTYCWAQALLGPATEVHYPAIGFFHSQHNVRRQWEWRRGGRREKEREGNRRTKPNQSSDHRPLMTGRTPLHRSACDVARWTRTSARSDFRLTTTGLSTTISTAAWASCRIVSCRCVILSPALAPPQTQPRPTHATSVGDLEPSRYVGRDARAYVQVDPAAARV